MVLDEARVLIEAALRDQGSVVQWIIPESLPLVEADHHSLLQVFLNLARNSEQAMRATQEKVLRVGVSMEEDMLPRIPALDALSLADAMRRGDADFQASRAVADQCAIECSAPRTQQPLVCSTSCGDKTTLDRVTACDRPTWLPP